MNNQLLSFKDYLLNCALYYAFRKLDNPLANRNMAIYAYSMANAHRCDSRSLDVINRIGFYPSKTGFIFDQYYYSAFATMPHQESDKPLPKVQTATIIFDDLA